MALEVTTIVKRMRAGIVHVALSEAREAVFQAKAT
jgi:hypothetical protein